jgi:endonuclease G
MNIFTSNRNAIANNAGDRFYQNLSSIEHIKNGIELNRAGRIKLTEISSDLNQLENRINREALSRELAIERINGVPNFQDISILSKLIQLSKSVCRILIGNNYGVTGYATGFLISPNLIITNNHVFPDPQSAENAIAQFNYEMPESNKVLTPVNFRLLPSKFFLSSSLKKRPGELFSGLDFTIVALETINVEGSSLRDFGFIGLVKSQGKIIEGENCVIIQHPKGDYKKIVLKDIRMINLTDDFLIYESDTLPGSSGSAVIGLGTGEVVALHHTGVPKMDSQGNWLRKDGTRATDQDDDEDIDWIGNEGVRVSRIVDATLNISVPDNMVALKKELIEVQRQSMVSLRNSNLSIDIQIDNEPNIFKNGETTNSKSGFSGKTLQHFEIILRDDELLMDKWEKNKQSLIAGYISDEITFPLSHDPIIRRMHYLTLQSADDPWIVSAQLELLPHIELCTPDLPVSTDYLNSKLPPKVRISQEEFDFDFIYNDGTTEWDEERFLSKWKEAYWFKKALKISKTYYRQWNWLTVNHADLSLKNAKGEFIRKEIIENTKKLRFVQLDTGYSSHSKVFKDYDLDQDMDFIGGDSDAKDEMKRWVNKFPGHGTRTASIAIGGKLKEGAFKEDGNCGLLTLSNEPFVKLIPYRIAESPVLINRGKQLVDAASYAIHNKTDVLFMCMGTLPRPMFDAVAREAYENGVIWICAAGNKVKFVVAPALYPGTIAVAASNPADKPWDGSSRGKAVDITAPGEDVYVPFWNNYKEEIMAYGNGTSYATPHVASAAMLWKAKWYYELTKKYHFPWQIIEAFRYCLTSSARIPKDWDEMRYGAGILDITMLLEQPLPEMDKLYHAYDKNLFPPHKDIGIREVAFEAWNNAEKIHLLTGTESMQISEQLTERGRLALEALGENKNKSLYESNNAKYDADVKNLLENYFDQY